MAMVSMARVSEEVCVLPTCLSYALHVLFVLHVACFALFVFVVLYLEFGIWKEGDKLKDLFYTINLRKHQTNFAPI